MTRPLPLPTRWVDELVRQRAESVRPTLCLSTMPAGIALPDGTSTEDLRADLEHGAWLVGDPRRPGWFRLGGDNFELSVQVRPAENGRHRIAVVHRAEPLQSVPPSPRMRPRVDFARVYDEVPCDLATVLRQLNQAGVVRRQLQRARPSTELRRHGSLRALVSKQYGQLGTLLKLLAERAARQPELEAAGIVMPSDQVRIELAGSPSLPAGRRVTIQVDDEDYQGQVSQVDGRVLTIGPMRDWNAAPGTPVVVTAASRFAMRQNAEALDRFQREEIDGDWHSLATLLCEPDKLYVPGPVPMPERFFSDIQPGTPPLNEPQRAAVAGALASPHAFLVQGPPGTGKTTVISELIRQLIDRGERVLMLAPSHVAVDEVLGRVGAEPGIHALRITWNADRVDAKLHPYLFDRVGRDLARLALHEGADRQARWTRRAAELDGRIARLTELRAAERAERARATAYVTAGHELTRARDAERALEAEAAAWEKRIEAAREEVAAAEKGAEAAARERAGYDREARPRLIVLHEMVTAAVIAADRLTAARAAAADAERMVREWTATIEALDRRLRAWRAHAAENVPLVNARLAEAAQIRANLQSRVTTARWLAALGLGYFSATRRRAEQAERAWQHWYSRGVQLERSAAAAAADERTLAAYHSNREAWRRLVPERTAARQAAESAWSVAVRRLAEHHDDVFATGIARIDLEIEPFAIWRERCADWSRGLDAVLGIPARPPDAAGSDPLSQLLGRYWRAQRRDVEATARTLTAAEGLTRSEHTAAAARERAQSDREEARAAAAAAERLVESRRAELRLAEQKRAGLTARAGEDGVAAEEVEARIEAWTRERTRMNRYAKLRSRWEELTAGQQAEELVEDVRRSFVRATNLVCATTRGIVSRGSQPVRDTDFDTLIVDEASRVTESEFLIGAVRARRWILVGDEHQLPPHVDGDDEQHLHALAAIHRLERGASPSLASAVEHLAGLWQEDDELHQFRAREVTALAEAMQASGEWADGYRETFSRAFEYFATAQDGDTALLQAMRRHLVHSLFQRATKKPGAGLCRPLLEQRRMVPALSRVVREPVYHGRLQDPPPEELERIGLRPITTPRFPAPVTLIDTTFYADQARDRQVGRTFTNPLEQEAVLWALRSYDEDLFDAGLRSVSVSVLAFYKAQAADLDRRIDRSKLKVLEPRVIDVIDAIQGQQSDIVLLSFTRAIRGRPSPRFGRWLQDVRRLNVACTRARRALVLVGHGETLRGLNGVDEASAFYAHLFWLFDEGSDQYQVKGRFR
jgi:hypothetical protein